MTFRLGSSSPGGRVRSSRDEVRRQNACGREGTGKRHKDEDGADIQASARGSRRRKPGQAGGGAGAPRGRERGLPTATQSTREYRSPPEPARHEFFARIGSGSGLLRNAKPG